MLNRSRSVLSFAAAAFAVTALLSAALLAGPSFSAVLRVTPGAPGPSHDGTTWETAFVKVQDAVNAAHSGDEVWVAKALYRETVRIPLAVSVSLYGGFSGLEQTRSERSPDPALTILDGNAKGTVLVINAPNVTVDGFTIRGGKGDSNAVVTDPSNSPALQGSGIYCAGSGAVINHNIITGNNAGYGVLFMAPTLSAGAGNGGGVFCSGDNAVISNNTITSNTTTGLGGIWSFSQPPSRSQFAGGAGVYLLGSGIVLQGNTIRNNTVSLSLSTGGNSPEYVNDSAFGAGISSDGPRCVIRGNVITDNTAKAWATGISSRYTPYAGGSANGGGINITSNGAGTLIADNLIAGNKVDGNASNSGGGIYSAVPVTLVNNTIAGNSAVQGLGTPPASGGLEVAGGTVTNNIVAFNVGTMELHGATTSHNDFHETAVVSATDITMDPLFVSASGGDYHLQFGSPCIDTGDDSVVQAGDRDLDGTPRKLGAHVDIGCYEKILTTQSAAEGTVRALRIAAGTEIAISSDIALLDTAKDGKLSLTDVVKLLRKGAGMD